MLAKVTLPKRSVLYIITFLLVVIILLYACGNPATALRTLLCIDAPTGRVLWKEEEPSKTYKQHRDNS